MTVRAGIIPLCGSYYGFGLDATYHTLMDFGGHRESYEDAIACALREAWEESFGLFTFQREDLLPLKPVVTASSTLFFLPIEGNPEIITDLFMHEVLLAPLKQHRIESSGIIWLSETELQTYLQIPSLWYPPVHEAVLLWNRGRS